MLQTKQRYEWVDIARGIAMMMVVFTFSFITPLILRGALVGQFFMLIGYLLRNQMKAHWSWVSVLLIW